MIIGWSLDISPSPLLQYERMEKETTARERRVILTMNVLYSEEEEESKG